MAKNRILRISLRRSIAPYLALRETADRLFDQIEHDSSKEAIVDFSGIESMTRSFAHQYILRKQKSRKTISEVHVTPSAAAIMDMSTKPVAISTVAYKSIKPMKLLL